MPVAYDKYKVGVPYSGNYKEVFCSDLEDYGGDGSLNKMIRASKRSSCDDRKNSITIGLAPLSMSIFKLTNEEPVKTTSNKKGTTQKKSVTKKTTGK